MDRLQMSDSYHATMAIPPPSPVMGTNKFQHDTHIIIVSNVEHCHMFTKVKHPQAFLKGDDEPSIDPCEEDGHFAPCVQSKLSLHHPGSGAERHPLRARALVCAHNCKVNMCTCVREVYAMTQESEMSS